MLHAQIVYRQPIGLRNRKKEKNDDGIIEQTASLCPRLARSWHCRLRLLVRSLEESADVNVAIRFCRDCYDAHSAYSESRLLVEVPAQMTIGGIDTVAVVVSERRKALQWFKDVLGLHGM